MGVGLAVTKGKHCAIPDPLRPHRQLGKAYAPGRGLGHTQVADLEGRLPTVLAQRHHPSGVSAP